LIFVENNIGILKYKGDKERYFFTQQAAKRQPDLKYIKLNDSTGVIVRFPAAT